MQVNSRGVRLNPNLRRSEDIYVQIAAHKARKAKGTPKQQIDRILSGN